MRLRNEFLIRMLILSVFRTTVSQAASVYEKNGNLFYISDATGKAVQVANSGLDKEPVLHPKGGWIYFVRGPEGKWVGEEYHPSKGTRTKDYQILKEELWRVKKDGTGAAMLFQSKHTAIDGPDPNYSVASVENIQFSPSGDKVYFETPEWVTSAGLHVMNADGTHEKLLGGGNNTKIVLFSGSDTEKKYNNYQGYIITSQHRYWWFGGSYDWWFLFTPDFKEVGPLGSDVDYFTEMGSIKYTDCSEKKLN